MLNEVDRLSDRLHEEFITITEDDYRMFGPELKIVISTLKALRRESQSRPEPITLSETTTIKAIAIKDGVSSSVTSRTLSDARNCSRSG